MQSQDNYSDISYIELAHNLGFPMILVMVDPETELAIQKQNAQAREGLMMEAVHRDLGYAAHVSMF